MNFELKDQFFVVNYASDEVIRWKSDAYDHYPTPAEFMTELVGWGVSKGRVIKESFMVKAKDEPKLTIDENLQVTEQASEVVGSTMERYVHLMKVLHEKLDRLLACKIIVERIIMNETDCFILGGNATTLGTIQYFRGTPIRIVEHAIEPLVCF